MTPAGVLDTSVFIAHESGRPMNFALLRLRIHLAEVGRRVRINDLWIARSPRRVDYRYSLRTATSTS